VRNSNLKAKVRTHSLFVATDGDFKLSGKDELPNEPKQSVEFTTFAKFGLNRGAIAMKRKFEFFWVHAPSRPFQIIAHRGMKDLAPENTKSAIEKAIEFGIEWVEVDVRLTRDGHHVIVHDSRLDRVTNGSGLVSELTLAEIKALDAGSWFSPEFASERILSLPECLELACGRINLYLDCKHVDVRKLVKEILQAKMEKQVVVYGKPDLLGQVKELSGGQIAIMAKWTPEHDLRKWISEVQPEAVEVNAPAVTFPICSDLHEQGIYVEAKTLGDRDCPEFWGKVIEAGVDWIQTGRPLDLIAYSLRNGRCPKD